MPKKRRESPMKECPLETYSVGISKVPNSDSEINECVNSATMFHRGAKLGCGEQGCTYSLVEDPSHVIKVTKLTSQKAKQQWRQEACIGREIGALGVAPGIPKLFECNSNGYIVMDLLKDAKKLPDGTVIRDKSTGDAIDHMMRMPDKIQIGFINVLAKLIDNGFMHMDNHIENLGFIKGKPVIFDFGFTQRRVFETDEEKLYGLSFSLFQMLEHCPSEELMCGPIWDVATAVLDYNVDWHSWASAKGMTMKDLKDTYPKGTTLKMFQEYADEISIENADLVVGALCYAMVLQKDLHKRYDVEPFYDVIYDIRMGKY
jgi:tRNA A-37 threonylcarbamoyl transferase component Bud32